MHALLSHIGDYPNLALFVVFLTSFMEAVALIGTLVPAGIILFAAGALVAAGVIDIWLMLGVATLGAVGGDGFSYELGRRYADRIQGWRIFARYATVYQRGENFVQRYGGRSILLARFVAPVRAVVPVIAGVVYMSRRKFYFVNLVSALIWAPLHILPGVLFGASLHVAEAVSGRLAVVVLLLVGLVWGVVWLVRVGVGALLPRLIACRDACVLWAREHRSLRGRVILFFFDPTRAESHMLLMLALLVVGSAALFFTILKNVVAQDALVQVDVAIFHFFQDVRTTAMDQVMVCITELGSTGVLLPLVLSVLAVLLIRRSWHTAIYWVTAALSSAVMVPVLQFTLGRHRPVSLYAGEIFEKFSFPSEHATSSMVIYGFLSFLLARKQRPLVSITITVIASVTIVLIGFSRLYLGAHWFSDVIGGFSLGLLWITLLAMMFTHYQPRQTVRARHMGVLAMCAVLLFGAVQIERRFTTDLKLYSPVVEQKSTSTAQWQAEGWQQLPRRRIVIAGEARESFNLQWAGTAAAITERMRRGGWLPAPEWTVQSSLSWLQADATASALPVLPRFNAGTSSSLAFIHVDPQQPHSRLVMQLWESNLLLSDPPTPVWYGGLYRERIMLPWRLVHLSQTTEVELTPAGLREWPVDIPRVERQDASGIVSLIGP